MTSRLTRSARLATGLAVVVLAVPVFGVLLWGAWRLLFWGVVGAAPHVRYGHASGMASPGPLPPGTDALLVGSGVPGVTPWTTVTVGVFVALVFVLVAVVIVTGRERDTPGV